jgi:hypothetical protein
VLSRSERHRRRLETVNLAVRDGGGGRSLCQRCGCSSCLKSEEDVEGKVGLLPSGLDGDGEWPPSVLNGE